ncbi:Acetyltransferase (GNAT) [Malassezia psittaci]|uniref:Acetyltransferase (GNAT) n=1 Tax=Malassezia psittaci TaxID=1821823 RepID=A0AAF0FD81_9BASI|nr:Acetyltransferase (GNAT) [Malassezia psittaci]
MSRVAQPELKRFLERRVAVNIQGGRKIHGVLRGYDIFLNLVIDDSIEQVLVDNNKNLWEEGSRCGTVVHAGDVPQHVYRKDVGTILRFIKELAIYEKALEKVDATEESLEETLFNRPYAYVLIAEIQQGSQPVEPVGFALYFYAYSTWTSRPTLHLEDLFVLQERRNLGIGKRIFKQLGQIAKEEQCLRIEWNVLTWNAPAIAFYQKTLGAEMLEEWRTLRLEGDGIQRLASLSSNGSQ